MRRFPITDSVDSLFSECGDACSHVQQQRTRASGTRKENIARAHHQYDFYILQLRTGVVQGFMLLATALAHTIGTRM